MSVALTWGFYKRLKTIIPNLPMGEVVEFKITGGVDRLVTIEIKQWAMTPEGKQIFDTETKKLVFVNRLFQLVELKEEEIKEIKDNE